MANPNPSVATRFKRGQINNPRGAAAHSPAIKALRKLTIESYREVIELTLTGTTDDLLKLIRDPTRSAIQVGVATSFLKAIKTGNWFVIDKIAERIVGKTSDNLVAQIPIQQTISIDRQELAIVIRELEAEF